MFEEISNDQLYDLNAGGILETLGYAIGRIVGAIADSVVDAQYHPSYPCGGECCKPRYYN